MEVNEVDRQETQRFALFDVLVRYCGETLTPDLIDQIQNEMSYERTEGPCAWAFKK